MQNRKSANSLMIEIARKIQWFGRGIASEIFQASKRVNQAEKTKSDSRESTDSENKTRAKYGFYKGFLTFKKQCSEKLRLKNPELEEQQVQLAVQKQWSQASEKTKRMYQDQ